MATVRFSQELIDAIVASATNKMAQPIKDAQSTLDSEWGMRIYNNLFGEYIPAMHKVPDYFFKTVDSISLGKVGDIRVGVTIPLGSRVAWPTTFPKLQHASQQYSYGADIDIHIHPDSPFQELHDLVVMRQQKISQAIGRSAEFVDMVRQVVKAHATLAPALKMWPPLWDLIPESYKERHRLVVERTKSEVTVDVDFTKLTAMATAAKLRG